MGVRVERPAGGGEPPEGMNGFVLAHVVCEHGEPYVQLEIWKEDPMELVAIGTSFIEAGAECESKRQDRFNAARCESWSPSGPDDQAGFGTWPRPSKN